MTPEERAKVMIRNSFPSGTPLEDGGYVRTNYDPIKSSSIFGGLDDCELPRLPPYIKRGSSTKKEISEYLRRMNGGRR